MKTLAPLAIFALASILSCSAFAQQNFRKELPVIADAVINIPEELHRNGKLSSTVALDLQGDDAWDAYCGNPHCNGAVFAISERNYEHPVIGGAFDSIAGVQARGIARFLYSDTTFTEIGGGISGGAIYAIYEGPGENELYIGGNFKMAGGVATTNIAHWDGAQWEALGTGTDSTVLAITLFGNSLYVGGNFNHAGGIPANYISIWDIVTKEWIPVVAGSINGMNGGVAALANDQNNIYAGGGFTKAGNTVAAKIGRFDGANWSAIDQGVSGINAFVDAITTSSVQIEYIGGSFSSAGGSNLQNFASFNGTRMAWESFGGKGGVDGPVYAISKGKLNQDPLVIGGDFLHAGGVSANHIATINIFSGSYYFEAWGSGVDSSVYALAGEYMFVAFQTGENPVFVGGIFQNAGTKPSPFFAVHSGPANGLVRPEKSAENWIKLYPNPAHRSITLESVRQIRSLAIMDALGRAVMNVPAASLREAKTTLDISHLAPGMYNALAETSDGMKISQFIVSH